MAFYGLRRGQMPYFRDCVKHSILILTGTFGSAMLAEKVAAEVWYNQILITMADKYNFSQEEVMDL
eukprot:CAMPEP_0116881172 /NCGR_PEP_ID=MMETSP0463-20121206/13278_1 /TAXON_ID=181622 /ORGANISM="Strombidinopsis sp, Strain SopsisLIS2011" /LENGTH=65 /DNA_ID=CAMNT_0004532839 /DNA_START=219 /DNA_END=416 /DNA_ORIENTATION=-